MVRRFAGNFRESSHVFCFARTTAELPHHCQEPPQPITAKIKYSHIFQSVMECAAGTLLAQIRAMTAAGFMVKFASHPVPDLLLNFGSAFCHRWQERLSLSLNIQRTQ
jgi:hypothetical protein